MAWTTAVEEFRELTGDGATDKLRARKRAVGSCNGVNTVFKTFEFRRVTNFTTSTFPLGVFINDSATAAALVSDDVASGTFVLTVAPITRQFVEATYYIQYFVDTEINNFLKHAAEWLISSPDIALMPLGLQPAALKYAASEGYQKLADKFQDTMSDTYRMEDTPDNKQTTMVEYFQKRAEFFKSSATTARDEYYTRQGQSLQPLFISSAGGVRDVPPRR